MLRSAWVVTFLLVCACGASSSLEDQVASGDGTQLGDPDPAVGDGDGSPVSEADGGHGHGDGAVGGDALADDGGGGDASGGDADTGYAAYVACFQELFDPNIPQPEYAIDGLIVGSHCRGTNHQDIRGVERVVFVGDSVTVGTPPTATADWYRNRLAVRLAARFGLTAPNALWQQVNYVSGETLVRESGAYAWLARSRAAADALAREPAQLEDCLPPDERAKPTLIVMTMGGNDLNSIMQGFGEGKTHDELWDETRALIDALREAIAWVKEPGRFPNGVWVVMSNLYEYTDGSGKVESCPAAALGGFHDVDDPALTEMVIWAMEQYVQMAVDYDVDLAFLLEQFCGHGYQRADPSGRCYRGPGAELWFDDTCIHPNAIGHQQITDMLMAIVEE